MANYILKVIKNNINEKILFDADNDENIVKIISTEKYNYASIEVVEGTTVTYTVVCDGYQTISNSIFMDKDYELIPELKQIVTLTIIPNPSDAKVVLSYKDKNYEQNSLEIAVGTPITYTVSKINMQTIIDSIIIERDTTINVNLLKNIKDDADIAEYEKNYSDDLNKINTISRKEYESLPDELRNKYIKYSDLLTRIFGVDYNRTLNDCIVQLYWALPIADRLTPFTNGTLGTFQTDFINFIAQLNSLFASAGSVGDKIKSLQKPLNKVGLGSLTDILTTAFGLIGGIGGIIWAIMNNPNIFIKTFAQQFETIDLKDIYDRTIGETIPNLDYLKQMVNRTYLPDNDLKKTLLYQINEVSNMADLSLDVLGNLAKLKQLVEVANMSEDAMQALLQNISTMGVGWAIAYLTGLIDKLGKNKDKTKYTFNNNNASRAFDAMKNSIDNVLNGMNEYYINENDLAKFNKATNSKTSTQKIFDYENGFNDGLNNGSDGETEEQKRLRLQKLKEEMEKLGKDASPYILGYNSGWKTGNENYLRNISDISQLQQDSYNQGYNDGKSFGSDVNALVKSSLEMGDMKMFIDEDWHLHNVGDRYAPFGRIELGIAYDNAGNKLGIVDVNDKIYNENERIGRVGEKVYKPINDEHVVIGYINGNKVYDFYGTEIGTIQDDDYTIKNGDIIIGYKKLVYYVIDKNGDKIGYVDEKGWVYDFNEDMSEKKIGIYDSNTNIMLIEASNKSYFIVDNQYVYDTDSHTDNAALVRTYFYNINLMRVQRRPLTNYLNPFYANGWENGYRDKREEVDNLEELLDIQNIADDSGFLFAKEQKDLIDVAIHLDEQKELNPDDYPYYSQGFITGYNKYQSEYNSTYTKGWYSAVTPDEDITYTKNDFLNQIIEDYHLENLSPAELAVNSYYKGASNGWDDSLNPQISEQRFKELYLDY